MNEPQIFATAGGNTITIYECKQDVIIPIRSYVDPNEKEEFFTLCWSYNSLTLDTILIFGGAHGIIKVIYPISTSATQLHIGHCKAINDLKVHPKDPSILLSAGGDHAIRLWNIESGQCIAVFGGVDGHTDQVVNVDFDFLGKRIISSGFDTSLKIWRIDKSPIKELIEKSFCDPGESDRPFRTFIENYPEYTAKRLHRFCVDCVKWYGNTILSKVIYFHEALYTSNGF